MSAEIALVVTKYILEALWKIGTNAFKHPTSTSTIDLDRSDFPENDTRRPSQPASSPIRYRTTDAAPTGLIVKRRPAKSITVSPTFNLVFLSVLGITVAAGIAQVVMATAWPQPTVPQGQVFEAMGFAWKAGIGAIFGLLGGKAA